MIRLLDFIHVGDFKTGTTWLQNHIFPGCPDIEYLGDPFYSDQVELAVNKLLYLRDLDFDADSLRKEFEEVIPKTSKKIGISREAFTATDYLTGENARRTAERIKAVFGEVQILYVIREPVSMLKSLYSQYVKMGGVSNIKEFFLDPYSRESLLDRLCYSKNIQMYYEIFEQKNVLVLTHDELKANPVAFAEKINCFLGISIPISLVKVRNEEVNKSLSVYGMFFSRFFNIFVKNMHNREPFPFKISRFISFFMSIKRKKLLIAKSKKLFPYYLDNTLYQEHMIDYLINIYLGLRIRRFAERFSFGPGFKVPLEIAQIVRNYTAESNRKLIEEYRIVPEDLKNWSSK